MPASVDIILWEKPTSPLPYVRLLQLHKKLCRFSLVLGNYAWSINIVDFNSK